MEVDEGLKHSHAVQAEGGTVKERVTLRRDEDVHAREEDLHQQPSKEIFGRVLHSEAVARRQ